LSLAAGLSRSQSNRAYPNEIRKLLADLANLHPPELPSTPEQQLPLHVTLPRFSVGMIQDLIAQWLPVLLMTYWLLAAGSVVVTVLPIPVPQSFK
jgi:hypothetical protein